MSPTLFGIYIDELESHLEEHEVTIDKMEGRVFYYTNEIAKLSQALENLNEPPRNILRRLLL